MIKEKDIVKATHDGVLPIGDIKLDVAVLQGGQRIITQNSVFSALGRPPRGNSRVINTPVFMDANNLQPFVGQDLRGELKQIDFIDKKGGCRPCKWYEAYFLLWGTVGIKGSWNTGSLSSVPNRKRDFPP